jgi:HPt (histidine-containing phosphotransfer) domain-containing protein
MVATMVDHELNELRREFLDEARGKVTEMQSALTGEHNPDALERLSYLAHQLKGSGGSYGYQRISDDASGLEKAIQEGRVDGDLAPFVERLGAEIERASKELD